MILDRLLPTFDATRVEHVVVPASPDAVYAAAVTADFAEVPRRFLLVRSLFAMRTAAERLASSIRSRPDPPVPAAATMRLRDLPGTGEWVRLGNEPPREFAFGAIGRFWAGETRWVTIDADEFAPFVATGFAKIGCSLTMSPLGDGTTLLRYEARTRATDAASRRAFRRYWWVVSPFVGAIMRATLTFISRRAAPRPLSAPWARPPRPSARAGGSS